MLTSYCFIKLIYFTSFAGVVVAYTRCLQCKKQKCDSKNNCLDGCIPGFAGLTCLHECPSNCINLLCNYDRNTGAYPCSIGCMPGYHALQCNTPCENLDEDGKCDRFSGTSPDCEGRKYGENCETSCRSKCGGSVCDNKGRCFNESCIPGRYGAGCRELCEADCQLCHKHTGECILTGETDKQDTSKCVAQVNDYSRYLIGILLLLAIITSIIGVGVVILYKIYLNSRNASRMSDKVREEDPEITIVAPEEAKPARRYASNRGTRKRSPKSSPEGKSLMKNGK